VAWHFYVELLGLPGQESLGANRPFELLIEPLELRVLVYPVIEMRPQHYPHETGVVLVLYTNDIRTTVVEWLERGVSFVPISWSRDETGIAESPFGPFIAFRDPFGNVHELLEPRAAVHV